MKEIIEQAEEELTQKKGMNFKNLMAETNNAHHIENNDVFQVKKEYNNNPNNNNELEDE